ncbi:MAG: hypothetical protein NC818_04020 [Candidatus Omnitrophica bacterium]|nr:hypothetical protein [Candidatus Omnitrophota bacterium]
MWLVTTVVSAVGVTILNLVLPKKYKFKLGFLALMLWGATVMILIDHILGYEGGPFLEKTTEGLIKNGTFLGLAMLVPVLGIWMVSVLITNSKRR